MWVIIDDLHIPVKQPAKKKKREKVSLNFKKRKKQISAFDGEENNQKPSLPEGKIEKHSS